MKRVISIVVCGFFIVLAHATETSTNVAKLFATPENLQIALKADKVDACLLRHIEPAVRPDGSVDWRTERFEETTFVPVPTATVTALREQLLNDKTYDWKSGGGGHRPQFYLRLRFHRGEEIIAVDFCFICRVLGVTKNGEELGHANFGRNGDLFLPALLKIFPDDAPLKHAAKEAGLPP